MLDEIPCSSVELWPATRAKPIATKTPDWVDPVVEEVFGQLDEGSKYEFGEMDKVWLCAAYYFQISGLLG